MSNLSKGIRDLEKKRKLAKAKNSPVERTRRSPDSPYTYYLRKKP